MARALDRLLDSLFDSILDEPPWLGFLDALESCMPCHHATMVLRKPRDGDPGVMLSAPRNQAALAALQQGSYRDSPFLELPEGQVCILGEMMTPEEFRTRHPRYYDYIRQHSEVIDLIGLDIAEPRTGMTFRLRGARLAGEPAFGAAERKLLQAILPRLRTAIALFARIALQSYQLSVLDENAGELSLGSMVIDCGGRVLVKNMVADRMLQARDGFYLRDGVLQCTDARDQRQLKSLLGRYGSGVPEQLRQESIKIRRGSAEQSWSVLLRPSRARPGLQENASATVVVLLRDAGKKPEVSDATLIELFGLTRAEAALAARLVRGQSVNEASAELGISRFTARAQLASVFARTGTHRQSQLVSQILVTVNTVWA